MKRYILYFLSIMSLSLLQAAEQKNDYTKYENLPERMFLSSFMQVFYIKPQRDLGSQQALNNFLSSEVIRKALQSGEGVSSGINYINISIPQSELKAFAQFAKNLAIQGQSVKQAYEDAFGTNDGIKIMQDLQVNPELIMQVQEAITEHESPIIPESPRKKPKVDTEKKITKKLPEVHIVRPGKLMTTLELTNEQIEQLNTIDDSTIHDLIEISDEPIVTIELSPEFEHISNDILNNFVNLIIKLYANDKKPTDLEFFTNVLEFLFNLAVDSTKIVHNLKVLVFLADWFGYYKFSKKLQPISFLLSIPEALSKTDITSEKPMIKIAHKLATDFKVSWSTQEIPDLLEQLDKIIKLQNNIKPTSSSLDILKMFFGSQFSTLQDLNVFYVLNDKIKKAILIASVLQYKALKDTLQGFYTILNSMQDIKTHSSLIVAPHQLAEHAAQSRNKYLKLRADINKFAQNLKDQDKPQVLAYLKLLFMKNDSYFTILNTLPFIH